MKGEGAAEENHHVCYNTLIPLKNPLFMKISDIKND